MAGNSLPVSSGILRNGSPVNIVSMDAQSPQDIDAKISRLKLEAKRARYRLSASVIRSGAHDTWKQSGGIRMRNDNHTGMPGLSYERDHAGDLAWIVQPPAGSRHDARRFGYRAGDNALLRAIRYNLLTRPRLPLTDHQWQEAVEQWQRLAPGERFDANRLLASRSSGGVRIGNGVIQAVACNRGVQLVKSFSRRQQGSWALAKIATFVWLQEQSRQPPGPRIRTPTVRSRSPHLIKGVRRIVRADRRRKQVVYYEVDYRPDAGSRWLPRRFLAGRVDKVTPEAEAIAARAAIAFRISWENFEDGRNPGFPQMDWSNWRKAFAVESAAEAAEPCESGVA